MGMKRSARPAVSHKNGKKALLARREGKKIIMRDAHNDKTLVRGMGQGTNPDVQHAHRAWQKDLFKVARIFYASILGFCLAKDMALFHISIFSRKRRRNRNLCAGRQADDCGNRDGITT